MDVRKGSFSGIMTAFSNIHLVHHAAVLAKGGVKPRILAVRVCFVNPVGEDVDVSVNLFRSDFQLLNAIIISSHIFLIKD